MKRVAKNADMNQGVNWQFISNYIDEVIAERQSLKMDDEDTDDDDYEPQGDSEDDIEQGFWEREALG